MDVKLPDGTIVRNVPDDITQSDLMARLKGSGISTAAITMPDERTRLENAYKEMASRNSFGQNLVDGGANAVQRMILEYKKMRGTATDADKQEFSAADKAFGATAGGKVGDLVTTAAPAVVATMVPGLNTIAGQAAIGGAMGAFSSADSAAERAANIGLGTAIGGAAKYGGDKLANFLLQRSANTAATKTATNEVRDAATRAAREAGYTLPPSSANPSLMNRAAEGFAGKISTQQSSAIKNQPITDALVRKTLGLPDDAPLTRETLVGIRNQAGAAYEAAKNLGRIQADDSYVNALIAIGKEADEIAKDFPGQVDDKVVKLVDTYLKDGFDSKSAVASMKYLRKQADSNLAPMAGAAEKTLGRAQKAIADALESQLERHAASAGDTATVEALRQARATIARTYSVEKALREGTGSVSANKLAQQLSKGRPLSPELRTIATTAQNFPRAVQDVTSSMPGLSPLDYGAAGGISAVTGSPSLLGLIAARPAVRSSILSAPYQRAMVNPPSYGPGLLGRATPAMLESPLGQMLLTSGLLGAATASD